MFNIPDKSTKVNNPLLIIVVGGVLLLFGLLIFGVFMNMPYLVFGKHDSVPIEIAMVLATIGLAATFCLNVGIRLFLNLPNKYQSILSPFG